MTIDGAGEEGPVRFSVFVAQAHSFTQQARLAITLAWIAGYTNIITLIVCKHASSHMTGTASDLGYQAVETVRWVARDTNASDGHLKLAGFAIFVMVTFVIGAAISGFLTETGRRRAWESIYILPMGMEAVLLGVFAVLLGSHEFGTIETGVRLYAITGVASVAMGLQNATITRISSGVVRTTHVTGVLTDLGMEGAQFAFVMKQWLHEGGAWRDVLVHPTARRLAMLGSIVLSLALGAGLGTVTYDYGHRWAMLPPVLFLLWIVWQDVRHPIAEIEPSELVADLGLNLPPEIVVYHLRHDQTRKGGLQRLPNLVAWSERVPRVARVVVLDLTDVTQLDGDAAYELRAALTRLHQQHQTLVIAGLSTEQTAQLRAAHAGEALDPGSVSPDLELAIARGLVHLENARPDLTISRVFSRRN